MIQRIQSLYLLIITAFSAVQFYFGGLYVLIAAGTLIPFISIFLYKNRKLQIILNYLNILLFLLILGIGAGLYFHSTRFAYISFSIPLINIILTFLVIRAIKKDENLVKSLDRIR